MEMYFYNTTQEHLKMVCFTLCDLKTASDALDEVVMKIPTLIKLKENNDATMTSKQEFRDLFKRYSMMPRRHLTPLNT